MLLFQNYSVVVTAANLALHCSRVCPAGRYSAVSLCWCSAVQCSTVPAFYPVQCSAGGGGPRQAVAATRLSWTQASWVVLSLAAEWGGNHPSPPTSQSAVTLTGHYYAAPATQQLRKWQIVQQISPETAVTVININITKKRTQRSPVSVSWPVFCILHTIILQFVKWTRGEEA